MTSTSENTPIELRAFPICLQEEGKITVPQPVQDNLKLTKGDMLTLLQVGDLVMLTATPLQVPQLADRITELAEGENLSMDDLLHGIETERQALWQARQPDA